MTALWMEMISASSLAPGRSTTVHTPRSPPVRWSRLNRRSSRCLEPARSACSRGGEKLTQEFLPHELAAYFSIMTQPTTPKRVSDSAIHDQTAMVFPNDLNTVGTLYG